METRKEIVDYIIKVLDIYKNKEGYIKYSLLYKLLIHIRDGEKPKDI